MRPATNGWVARSRPRPTVCRRHARVGGGGGVPSPAADDARAWVPIVYGCDKTCTYCIVPFARGPERSRPFDDIVAEVRALAASRLPRADAAGAERQLLRPRPAAGPRFAELRSQRTLGRRQDRAGRPDIAALLHAIDAIRDGDGRPGIPRVRFVTSHPWDLTDRLIEAMAECDSVCEHLHLPVQSGTTRCSSAWAASTPSRPISSWWSGFAPRCRASRSRPTSSPASAARPRPSSSRTLELLRTVRFEQVFAAAYSERPGTPATKPARRRARRTRRSAGSTSSWACRRPSGASATRPGSGDAPRCSSTRPGQPRSCTTTRVPTADAARASSGATVSTSWSTSTAPPRSWARSWT